VQDPQHDGRPRDARQLPRRVVVGQLRARHGSRFSHATTPLFGSIEMQTPRPLR
jgi:hypothetical protein